MKKEPDVLEILGIGKSEKEAQIDALAERIVKKLSHERAKQFRNAASELRAALDFQEMKNGGTGNMTATTAAQQMSFEALLEKSKRISAIRRSKESLCLELKNIPLNRDHLAAKGILEQSEYARLRGLIAECDARIAELITVVHEWFNVRQRETVEALEKDFQTVIGCRAELKQLLQRVAQIYDTARLLQTTANSKLSELANHRVYLARETDESAQSFQLPNPDKLPSLMPPGIGREVGQSCDMARIARAVVERL
jgi:hypothetical protein